MLGVELSNDNNNVGLVVVGGTSSGYSRLEGDVQGASEHAGEQGKGKQTYTKV